MIIQPLPCVNVFIENLNESLRAEFPEAGLTCIQRAWLVVVLMGIVVTDKLCWAVFERRGLNQFTQDQLRWMFTHTKLAWSHLLRCSVRIILKHYGINSGTLVVDETDKRRAKVTSKISGTHKIKDKKSSGYFNGQELVFLFLVTETGGFPVDFRFYIPDPEMSAWRKRNKKQKQAGIVPAQREPRPALNLAYPQKADLAIELLQSFTDNFPDFVTLGVLADALYGNASFMNRAAAATKNA